MRSYFIRLTNGPSIEYNFLILASSPEDVLGQVRALNAGKRLTEMQDGRPVKVDSPPWEMTDLSTRRTKGKEYLDLAEWVRG